MSAMRPVRAKVKKLPFTDNYLPLPLQGASPVICYNNLRSLCFFEIVNVY